MRPTKLYFVWDDSEEDESSHYFAQLDSLEGAVAYKGGDEPVEVFEANLKSIGLYKQQNRVVRVRSKKKN